MPRFFFTYIFLIASPHWGNTVSFQSAQPVWPEGRETEMNLLVGFRAAFESPAGENAIVRVAASTVYRLFLDGQFVGYGPARGPHGFYRVDEWDLSGKITEGSHVVAIEVAGYNVDSYDTIDQPSFLQAEVLRGNQEIASTGGEGAQFEAGILTARVQKVERYSFQRPFTDYWKLLPGWDEWRSSSNASFAKVKLVVQPAKALLPRRVPFPRFENVPPASSIAEGEVKAVSLPENPWRTWGLNAASKEVKGYAESELPSVPSLEIQRFESTSRREGPGVKLLDQLDPMKERTYRIFDFGVNLTGFIGTKITCEMPTVVYLTFDELLTNGDVDYKRLGCANVVKYELEPGEHTIETFEPYTLRYLKILVAEGDCVFDKVYLREYVNPDTREARFESPDDRLNRIFEAGRQSFRQNAVDVFMDCPHRERAGWLCDSFFTSRVAFDLGGNTQVEKAFFENYLIPASFAHLPEGMLPMCYPSDHNNGNFIPNWAMWFVVQLEEYLHRSGDMELVESFRPKVMNLFKYFSKFENSDGLLEKLEKWVFVEWSAANDFVQDVNYPTNMLYAAALSSAGRIYGIPDLGTKAEKIREVVRRQSFDGEFFVDNAVRKEGQLEITRNRSEVCQYFAFYFGVVTPESHPALWKNLCERFGPKRKEKGDFPEIHPANSFVGNVMRLELLSRAGRCRQMLEESVNYHLYMVEQTGTIWENMTSTASCNHGFGSHVVHTLFRDALGIKEIDPVAKRVKVRFTDVDLPWCKGQVPVGAESVSLEWKKKGDQILYWVSAPEGFEVEVENLSGKELRLTSPLVIY